MIIVVFRTHVKPQADLEKLNALNQQMVALVIRYPALKDFSAQDGEFLVLASSIPRVRRRVEGAPGAPRCTTARASGIFCGLSHSGMQRDPHCGLHS